MTSGAENSNLLAEFEEAFKETMSTLTQEDTMFDRSPETLQHELENKVLRFTEIARQLETFFSQKRYVIWYSRYGRYARNIQKTCCDLFNSYLIY